MSEILAFCHRLHVDGDDRCNYYDSDDQNACNNAADACNRRPLYTLADPELQKRGAKFLPNPTFVSANHNFLAE